MAEICAAHDYDNQADEPEARLAQMLARYEREVARALLEPLAARLPRTAAPAATRLQAPHALVVGRRAAQRSEAVVRAAIFIDPRWAIEWIVALPRGSETSLVQPADALLHDLTRSLARPYEERWAGLDVAKLIDELLSAGGDRPDKAP